MVIFDKKYIINFLIEIIIHVYCVYIVIGSLYFTFGSYVIENSIKKQLDMLCDVV